MNVPNQSPEDPLRPALRQWKISASLPPRFHDQIWRRIEAAETREPARNWLRLLRWLEASLPRPAIALSYFALLMAIAGASGYFRAQHEAAQLGTMLSERYVQTVDPYRSPSK